MASTTPPIPPLSSLTEQRAAKYHLAVMDKYGTRDRFGRLYNGSPTHRNSMSSPLSSQGGGKRRLDVCGPKRIAEHFTGSKGNGLAVFHVGRPDAQVVLLCIDIDAGKLASAERADRLASKINHEAFVGRGYVEVSRNRRGRYVWILVRRSEGETPEIFNGRINKLSKALREQYGAKITSDEMSTGVDAVKGTCWYSEPNPRFEPAELAADGHSLAWLLDDYNATPTPDWLKRRQDDVYAWHREHYNHGRGQFRRQEDLEPEVLHHGVLVTRPLHGVRHDADGGEQRWMDFHSWEADASKAIESSDLWARFGVETTDHKPSRAAGRKAARAERAAEPRGRNSKPRPHDASDTTWDVISSPAKDKSVAGCCTLALQRRGLAATPEQVASIYDQHGALTDELTAKRINHIASCLDVVKGSFDPAKRASGRLTDSEVRKSLRDAWGYLSSQLSRDEFKAYNAKGVIIDAIGDRWDKPRTYLSLRQSAVVWVASLWLIHRMSGGLPISTLRDEVEELGESRLSDTSLRLALAILHDKCGLKCIDWRYWFEPGSPANDYNKAPGRSRLWGLADGAPLPPCAAKLYDHELTGRQRARYIDHAGRAAAALEQAKAEAEERYLWPEYQDDAASEIEAASNAPQVDGGDAAVTATPHPSSPGPHSLPNQYATEVVAEVEGPGHGQVKTLRICLSGGSSHHKLRRGR